VSKNNINIFGSYIVALLGVGIGFFLRVLVVYLTGDDLATYITFYPVVMIVAVLWGLAPGILATIASSIIVNYWFYSPINGIAINNRLKIIEAAMFIASGILVNLVFEIYRRRNKKQTKELYENNTYNRAIIESSIEAFVTLSLEGKIIDANKAAVKITGIPKGELIGTDLSSHFVESQKADEAYKKVFAKGHISDYELTIWHKSGKSRDIIYSAQTYKGVDGNFLGILVTMQDVTEQKNMVKKLKKSQENLEKKVHDRTMDLENVGRASRNVLEDLSDEKAKDEAILESIGNGLVVTDIYGRITLINKVFEELLGWKETEARGKLLTDLIGDMLDEKETFIPVQDRPINKVLKERKKLADPISGFYKRQDGTLFPVQIMESPIFSRDTFIGVVEIFTDVTKEKAIDKAKTEFVSLASHQLRTPLSAINWYTEMLLEGDMGKLTQKQKEYLSEVSLGNKRMVELVNALLNTSRLELGTLTIDPKLTDIKEVIRSVINEHKVDIITKKIKLSVLFEKNIPLIFADHKLLNMIVENILSNALKYTDAGGEVEVSLSLSDSENLLLKISDTGYGIPKNQQSSIFTKLFRADNVREKDTTGTGLGLYIVKAILDKAKGKIWFTSKENKGSTFFVTMPIKGMKSMEGKKRLE